MKYEYLRSLQICEDQDICGKLKRPGSLTCAYDPYDLYGDQALSSSLVLKVSNKAIFKDFKSMTENRLFQPVNLLLS